MCTHTYIRLIIFSPNQEWYIAYYEKRGEVVGRVEEKSEIMKVLKQRNENKAGVRCGWVGRRYLIKKNTCSALKASSHFH